MTNTTNPTPTTTIRLPAAELRTYTYAQRMAAAGLCEATAAALATNPTASVLDPGPEPHLIRSLALAAVGDAGDTHPSLDHADRLLAAAEALRASCAPDTLDARNRLGMAHGD